MKNSTICIAIALLLALLCGLSGCGCSAQPAASVLTWQEQYDLGVRFLSEGNYQEAILAFEAAIEIDPKRFDVYPKLVNAYIAANDYERARNLINDLPEQMGEASGVEEIQSLVDSDTYGKGAGNTLERVFNGGQSVEYNEKVYGAFAGSLYVEADGKLTKVNMGVDDYYISGPLFVSGNWLYSMGASYYSDDYQDHNHDFMQPIVRYNFVTQEWQTIGGTNDINDHLIGIWDQYLFYYVNAELFSEEPDNIYRMGLDGSTPICITSGQELISSDAFVADGWVYYEDFADITDGKTLPPIENLSLYSANREYPNGRFLWGAVCRMDVNGKHIRQITDKEREEALGKMFAEGYSADSGGCVYLHGNNLYVWTGDSTQYIQHLNLSGNPMELEHHVNLFYRYGLDTGECTAYNLAEYYDTEAYLASEIRRAPVLVHDGMMWLVIWTDGEYHKTIMVDLESGQIQEPTDAQAAIGDLMSESDFVATVMNAYYYQPLEYEGEALIWGKVDFASGIRETFSFPDL